MVTCVYDSISSHNHITSWSSLSIKITANGRRSRPRRLVHRYWMDNCNGLFRVCSTLYDEFDHKQFYLTAVN